MTHGMRILPRALPRRQRRRDKTIFFFLKCLGQMKIDMLVDSRKMN